MSSVRVQKRPPDLAWATIGVLGSHSKPPREETIIKPHARPGSRPKLVRALRDFIVGDFQVMLARLDFDCTGERMCSMVSRGRDKQEPVPTIIGMYFPHSPSRSLSPPNYAVSRPTTSSGPMKVCCEADDDIVDEPSSCGEEGVFGSVGD